MTRRQRGAWRQTDAVPGVVREMIAAGTLAVVRADRVVARALTAAVVRRTLVHVCTFKNIHH